MTSPGVINWLRIAFIAMIWGGAFMVVRMALRDFQPLTLAAGRITIGAIALYGLMRWRGIALPSFKDIALWRFVLLVGLLSSAIPFALLSWGQQHVPSAFAGMTMAALPIFVLPLAHFFVPGERIFLRKLIGFGVGFLGAVLLIGTSGLGVAEGPVETLARFACVAAAFCYACGSIATRQCPPINELALSTGSLILAAMVLLPIALLVEGPPNLPSISGLLAIGYLGPHSHRIGLYHQSCRDPKRGALIHDTHKLPSPRLVRTRGQPLSGGNPSSDTLCRSGFDLVGGGDYSSRCLAPHLQPRTAAQSLSA